MKRLLYIVTVLVIVMISTMPAWGESTPATPTLPITRVVLFSSGVGYFQREGQVDGAARVDLQFPATDINDLLKSLVFQDMGGGQISTISYDNRNPIEMTLKSFALDLTQNPSLGDLLNQARGEQVEIVAGEALRAPAETITGVIVGVEKQKQAVGREQVIEIAQLNLLTADGLRGIPMRQIQRARFLKPALDQEFRKALEVLATGHDKQKKTVSFNFSGQGKRPVRVGYVTESPIWKTSYRLEVQKEKVFLQGWALVENTTDQDWNKVHLGLVSGRPISFQMDLYEPLYLKRPVIEPELFASLRPPSYNANLGIDQLQAQAGQLRGPPGMAGQASPRRAMPAEMLYMRQNSAGKNGAAKTADGHMNLGEGVASAANAAELGEYFQYAIQQPVTLPRQKSAMLPIVNQDVGGTKVSIFNEAIQAKYPLLGLRFKNNTPLHLAQGPATVFENDSYAGDARLPDLQPNETRLLSYAIDLGTEVDSRQKTADSLMTIKIIKGILHATYKLRETKTYTVKNRSERTRTLLIEHPLRHEYKLIEPVKPTERTRDVYRFELTAKPNEPIKLAVIEDLPRVEQITLTDYDDEMVRLYLRDSAASDKVKKALEQALALKNKVSATRLAVQKEEQALKVIEQDQTRMRANMARVPPTSDAYKRYLKKFDEQETEIEKRRAQMVKLQETADQQRKAYEEYLATLTVE